MTAGAMADPLDAIDALVFNRFRWETRCVG